MQNQGKVRLYAVDQIEKVLLIETLGHNPVKALPEHQGSAVVAVERSQQALGTGGGALEEVPAVVTTGGKDVEVPPQAAGRSLFAAGNSQSPALRKGGR